MNRFRSDRGATAVEFAIVLLPLIALVMGIIDFGQVYSEQLALTSAAREGARVMAVQPHTASAARTATIAAANGLSPALTSGQITISPSTCTAGQSVTVTITYPLTSVTGMFDGLFSGNNLTATGVMRCEG